MMQNERDQELLMDLHLGQLDEAQAAALRRRIETDAALRAESQALQRTLRLLDAYTVAPPADLVERVHEGVDRRLRPVKLTPETISTGGRGGFGGGLMSVRDLIAAAAMIAVALGMLVPAWTRAREEGRRALCQSHLRNIGLANASYAAGFGGQLPFAGYQAGSSWLPAARMEGATPTDNRRHAYLLVRQNLADPAWFVCPSRSDGSVLSVDNPQLLATFPDYRNANYSLQVMTGPIHISTLPNMPLMADQTPLFRYGRFVKPDGVDCNSPNHAHIGQNVLRTDGSVQWASNPFAGIGGDNIWLLEDLGLCEYKGVEVPSLRTDTLLVP